MIELSVVIITYNEERDIERCIKSVLDFADEVLVVDSFSTDKTQQIAEGLGAHFIQNKFEGHIQQKNFAAQQAKFNHVLSLDADEVVNDLLKSNILKAKENFLADGYYFNRLTNYCGKWIKHCGWYPDQKLRLWDRRKGEWGGENPHDKYEMQTDAKIDYLKGDLLHYSYHSITQHVLQANHFTNIGSQVAYKRGKKARIGKIIIYPFWKFIRDFFIKGGILDGYYGFIICMISANATFLKYIKLRELEKNNKNGAA